MCKEIFPLFSIVFFEYPIEISGMQLPYSAHLHLRKLQNLAIKVILLLESDCIMAQFENDED